MKSKKMLSALLGLVIVFSTVVPLFADQGFHTDELVYAYVQAESMIELVPNSRSQSQRNIMGIIEQLLAGMMAESQMAESELTGFDFEGRLELGLRFNAYRYEYVLEAISDIHWYPVLEDGRVVAVVSLHGDPLSPTITLRVEFAQELQHFLDSGNCTFALLFKGKNLYAVTYSDKTVLWTYRIPVVNSPHARFSREVVEMQLATVDAFQELKPSIDAVQLHFQLDYQEQELDIKSVQPFAGQGSLNVPVILQGPTNLCWAACVTSVGLFTTGEILTHLNDPWGVAAIMGIPVNAGATLHETRDALNRVFGVSRSAVNLGVTFNDARAAVNIGRPIIGFFFPSWGMGHAVVIRSFMDGMIRTVGYMDPNFGFASITIGAQDNGPLRIVVGGQIMTGTSQIR